MSATEKTINWCHSSQPNMYLVFEATPVGSLTSRPYEEMIMKVVQDIRTLEHLRIQEMCWTAHMADIEARGRGIELPHSQFPVAAIVRSPCVALRYRLESGQTRRLQVRLQSDADYETVLNLLKSFKCHIAYPSSRPTAEVQAVSSASNSTSQSRIRTAPSRFALNLQNLEIPPTTTRLEAVRNLMPMSAWNATATHPGLLESSRLDIADSTLSIDTQPGPSCVELSSLEPTNAALWTSGTSRARSAHAKAPVRSTPNLRNFPLAEENIQHSVAVNDTLEGGMPSSSAQAVKTYYERGLDTVHMSDAADLLHPCNRPSTAPVSQLPEKLCDVIPPRRTLPFEHEECRTSSPTRLNRKGTISGRSSSTLCLSPLPAPRFADATPQISRHEPKQTKLQALEIGRKSFEPQSGGQSLLKDSSSCSYVPSNRNPKLTPPSSMNKTRTMNVLTVVPESRTNARKTAGTCFEDSNTDPENLSKPFPDGKRSAGNVVGLPNGRMDSSKIDTEDNSNFSRCMQNNRDRSALCAYVTQSKEQRLTAIEDLICQYVKDDNFITLCEDVEDSWHRIQLKY